MLVIKPVGTYINPRLQAKYHLERLCFEFGTEAKLKWSHGRRFGYFCSQDNTIVLGPKVSNCSDALLHQYAHAASKSKDHDINYLDYLWEIILFSKGNPESYAWYEDHRVVFEYGKNKSKLFRCDF